MPPLTYRENQWQSSLLTNEANMKTNVMDE